MQLMRVTLKQVRDAHAGVVYRKYACTGSKCTFSGVFAEPWIANCVTPDCRGTTTPRRVYSTQKMIQDIWGPINARQCAAKSALRALQRGVLRTEKASDDALVPQVGVELPEPSVSDFGNSEYPSRDTQIGGAA